MNANTTITLKVSVSEYAISIGEQSNCQLCPVAQALAQATGKRVYVDQDAIQFLGRNYRLTDVPTPQNVRNFVCAFDLGYDVQPFEFELEVPAYVLESEAA